MQWFRKHIPAEANARNHRRVVFSVVRVAPVVTQRWGKYISAAMNEHETTQEVVFSARIAPRLHKEDLTRLE
jgi:hypothetical protein